MSSYRSTSFSPSRIALAVTLALGQIPAHAAAQVAPTQSLGALTGGIGITLTGKAERDGSGRSVSTAGDVNGDFIDDLIIGAPGADSDGNLTAGESYLVFGSTEVGGMGTLDLGALNGNNGITLTGKAEQNASGVSVSGAGDVNDDGVDDIIIGAVGADPDGILNAGESYIVFGGGSHISNSSGTFALGDLNGANGFVLTGKAADDRSGSKVSAAGDVNGDGVDDLIIGAQNASPNEIPIAGESYVVFGGRDVGSSGTLDLVALDGINGFTLTGKAEGDGAGRSVSAAGDINNDGVDDLIIGAWFASPDGKQTAGESYVVFGGRDVGSTGTLDLGALNGINGINGFTLTGKAAFDLSGDSVSAAGDVNGDGVDDLIIGATGADPDGIAAAGESYVVFGGREVGSTGIFDLDGLNGTNGFTLTGNSFRESSGGSVSAAGDVNGDGVDDLIIGARLARLDGNLDVGRSYVVFGGSKVGSTGTLELAALDGINGFTLTGKAARDNSGDSVSAAGDVNRDGVDDLIIGASSASPDGNTATGESYVVLMPLPDTLEPNELLGVDTSIGLGETVFRNFHPAENGGDRMKFTLASETIVLIETANDGTLKDYDTVLTLFDVNTNARISTNDDIAPGENLYSRISETLVPGDYAISVTSPFLPNTIPSYALSLTELTTCDVTAPELQFALGNNQFELLSLPCQPPPGTSVNDLFGDDIAGGYRNNNANTGTWIVFTWDPVSFTYVDPGPHGTLEPGQGFWIIQVQADGEAITLDLPAGSLRTRSTLAAASACSSPTGCLELPLSDKPFPIDPATNAPLLTVPHLIGNPYEFLIGFDDLKVTTTVGACSIASDGCTPNQATLPSSGGANVLGNVAFTFNSTLGARGDYERIISGSGLSPWQGFWVFELPAATGNNPVIRFPDLSEL